MDNSNSNIVGVNQFNIPNVSDSVLNSDDILNILVNDKRSVYTKIAYHGDMDLFCKAMFNQSANSELINYFLNLDKVTALKIVLAYKAKMIQENKSSNTINRRIASLKSLIKYAYKLERCKWTLEIDTEKVKPYRDTTGIPLEDIRRLLNYTKSNPRNACLCRILFENALRSVEIRRLRIYDFDYENKIIKVSGKGRNDNKEILDITDKLADNINDYLHTRKSYKADDPLFIAQDRGARSRGNKPLTRSGIYQLIRNLGKKAGVSKPLSPHMIRHSSITILLDHNNGNIRETMKFSRHSDPKTVMIYDDNRARLQGEASRKLSDLT